MSCKEDKDDSVEPLISCQNSVTELAEANNILSESSWEWVESRTQSRGGEVVTTPQTEGKTRSLNFNLGQSVEELENGQAINIWQYRIDISNDALLGAFNSVWIDANGNIGRNYHIDVCPESLKLIDTSTSLMTVTIYKKK